LTGTEKFLHLKLLLPRGQVDVAQTEGCIPTKTSVAGTEKSESVCGKWSTILYGWWVRVTGWSTPNKAREQSDCRHLSLVQSSPVPWPSRPPGSMALTVQALLYYSMYSSATSCQRRFL